jgi:hypothetical protein
MDERVSEFVINVSWKNIIFSGITENKINNFLL